MKILIDMNISPDWTVFLTHAGYETVHWSTIGRPDAPDSAILLYAEEHGFAVLTRDLDFAAMVVQRGHSRSSIIQLRVRRAQPDEIGTRVLREMQEVAPALEEGAVLTIDFEKSRLRLLRTGKNKAGDQP